MDQRCVPPAARLELELTRFGGHLEAISGGVRYEKYRPAYPPEFRRQMVDLVQSGRTPEELAEEFEPIAQSIAKGVRQADRDAGRRADGTTSAERQELSKLRNENRRLAPESTISWQSMSRTWIRGRRPGSRGVAEANPNGPGSL